MIIDFLIYSSILERTELNKFNIPKFRCAVRLEEIVRQNKAVPATIGILNGIIHVGKCSIICGIDSNN